MLLACATVESHGTGGEVGAGQPSQACVASWLACATFIFASQYSCPELATCELDP